MIIRIFFFIFFIFISTNLYASNIKVIDVDFLINECVFFKNIIKKIEIDQESYRKDFIIIEKELQFKISKIEELKLILNSDELDKEVSEYNISLNDFNNKIKEFNSHYDNELGKIKNFILSEIIELIKQYSIDNKIDLILDSKSYIIASNSINITNIILDKLNKVDFEINFEKFK